MVLVISDFYESPEKIVKTIEPLRFHGSEVILFHVLDPQEIHPEMTGPSILVDMETEQRLEVTPDYVKGAYRLKMDAHLNKCGTGPAPPGMGYHLMVTDRPLDAALSEYLLPASREEVMGFLSPWFLAGFGGGGAAAIHPSFAAPYYDATAGKFLDVLRARNSEFDTASTTAIFLLFALRAC